jgi:exosortase K
MASRLAARLNWTRTAQLFVVFAVAYGLKSYYATASPDQLRWILAPTTLLVELISRTSFAFESHAGYLNADRTFLIAGSCAGVNFLITAFLMLSLRRLWRHSSTTERSRLECLFIPITALSAYGATLVANTARICIALQMRKMSFAIDGLSGNQLHRFEGIFVYFGFLLLLFMVSERVRDQKQIEGAPGGLTLLRQSLFPLLIYYLTTLGIPLANIAYHRTPVGSEFWEHSLFVLLTPLPLILILTAWAALLLRRGSTIKGPKGRQLIATPVRALDKHTDLDRAPKVRQSQTFGLKV